MLGCFRSQPALFGRRSCPLLRFNLTWSVFDAAHQDFNRTPWLEFGNDVCALHFYSPERERKLVVAERQNPKLDAKNNMLSFHSNDDHIATICATMFSVVPNSYSATSRCILPCELQINLCVDSFCDVASCRHLSCNVMTDVWDF